MGSAPVGVHRVRDARLPLLYFGREVGVGERRQGSQQIARLR